MWFIIFISLDETVVCDQMKAIELYFHVVLFIMLCNVVQTYKFVNKTQACDHSKEN